MSQQLTNQTSTEEEAAHHNLEFSVKSKQYFIIRARFLVFVTFPLLEAITSLILFRDVDHEEHHIFVFPRFARNESIQTTTDFQARNHKVD